MGGGFQQGSSTLTSAVTVMSGLLNSLPSVTLQDTQEMNLQSHTLGPGLWAACHCCGSLNAHPGPRGLPQDPSRLFLEDLPEA